MDTRYAKGSLPWREGYIDEYIQRKEEGTLPPVSDRKREMERLERHLSAMRRFIRHPLTLITGSAVIAVLGVLTAKKVVDVLTRPSDNSQAPRIHKLPEPPRLSR